MSFQFVFVVDIYEQLKFNLYQDDAVTGKHNKLLLLYYIVNASTFI